MIRHLFVQNEQAQAQPGFQLGATRTDPTMQAMHSGDPWELLLYANL